MEGMKKVLHFVVVVLVIGSTFLPSVFGFVLTANAAATVGIPSLLSYQGRLKNSSGTALTGSYDFTFKLYDESTGGNLLWTETESSLAVTSGYFTTTLGDGTPFSTDVDFTKNLWLQISVGTGGGGSQESMSSRLAINSVAFALAARGVENAASAPSTTYGGRVYYNTTDGNLYVYNNSTGTPAWANTLLSSSSLNATNITAGTLAVANGGTGAMNASAARTSLGLAINSDVQSYDADLTTWAGISPAANIQTFLGSANYSAARSNLGVAINSDVQAYDADLTTYAGISPSANIQTLLGSADYAAVRTNLSLAVGSDIQAYDADLTTWAGISPAANIQTFLGSANYSAARSNLGVAINTDVQAYDADLTTYAGIGPSANIQTLLGSADFSAARTNLGLGTIATQASSNVSITGGTIGSGVTISGNATNVSGIVGIANGGLGRSWVGETQGSIPFMTLGNELLARAPGQTGQIFISVGNATAPDWTTATYPSTIAINQALYGTGTNVIGVGTLPIAAGGTGATNATDAQTNLGVLIGSNVQAYDADLTTYAGITPSANIQTLLASSDFATARTNLGLGTIATQNANNVSVSGGQLSGLSSVGLLSTGQGTLIGIEGANSWTSGRAISLGFSSPTILGGSIAGARLDFQTNVTATNQNVSGYEIMLPGVTNTGAGAYDLFGLNIMPSPVVQSTSNGTTTWKGINVGLPSITQSNGTVLAYGIDINGAQVNSGTAYGLHVNMSADADNAILVSKGVSTFNGQVLMSNASITGGSISGISALPVASGGTGAINATDARTNLSAAGSGANSDISSLSGLTGAITQAPITTGTLYDMQLETEWTGGTLINADFGEATTIGSNVVGMNLDFQTNVTGASDMDVTGVYVKMPAFAGSTASSTIYSAFQAGGGTISRSNNNATVMSAGAYIVAQDVNDTSIGMGTGIIQSTGVGIGWGASPISGFGNLNGLVIGYNPSGPAAGVASGQLYGININPITPGSGVETALNIGNGWDYGITINMSNNTARAINVGTGDVYFHDRVGMGTWTADGDVAVYYDTNSSSTNYLGTQASDIRLKKNIEPLGVNALDILSHVNAYLYNPIDEDDSSKKRLGIMAQEIMPYLPEMTFNISQENDPTTYYGVHYDKLPVLLLQAIKEQQAQIQSLSLGSGMQGSLSGNISVDNLTVDKHVAFGSDTVGQAKILPGATAVIVKFDQEYTYQPIVTLTLRGENVLTEDFKYTVLDESTGGFTIKISAAQDQPVEFNWHAFGAKQGQLTVSDGTKQNIEIVVSPYLTVPPAPTAPASEPLPPAENNDTIASDNGTAPEIVEPAPIVEPEPTVEPAPIVEPEPTVEPAPAVEPDPIVEPAPDTPIIP